MCEDKCHQLCYFIWLFNAKAKETFELGKDISFDKGGVAMRSRYCPVRQYNKDKPDKFRVDFFILADTKYYFIYHLDVYQGKNKANIDIDPTVSSLPTTQKAVANAILKSGIANDPNGCCHMFMDNRYSAPQLFALMSTNYNIRGCGTCKANRKGFDSEKLKLKNNCERGKFKRLVDKQLGMVITWWKDSKVVQTVSTIMEKGIGTVQRQTGPNKITVNCPNDIIRYVEGMGGVDRGDQVRLVGAGFSNVAHFKKWYKKAALGVADFCLLQGLACWNLSVEDDDRVRRGGIKKIRKLLKWEFCSVASEEMMTYTDKDDDSESIFSKRLQQDSNNEHKPVPLPKDFYMKVPTCMVCSMEEGILRKVQNHENKKGRFFSRRRKHLSTCSNPNCNIVCHSCCPVKSNMKDIPQFVGLTCFEIAHHPDCEGLFIDVKRGEKTYTRSVKNHPVPLSIKNIYKRMQPRQSIRGRGRPSNNQDKTRVEPPIEEVYDDAASAGNISNLTTPRNIQAKESQQQTMSSKRRRLPTQQETRSSKRKRSPTQRQTRSSKRTRKNT